MVITSVRYFSERIALNNRTTSLPLSTCSILRGIRGDPPPRWDVAGW